MRAPKVKFQTLVIVIAPDYIKVHSFFTLWKRMRHFRICKSCLLRTYCKWQSRNALGILFNQSRPVLLLLSWLLPLDADNTVIPLDLDNNAMGAERISVSTATYDPTGNRGVITIATYSGKMFDSIDQMVLVTNHFLHDFMFFLQVLTFKPNASFNWLYGRLPRTVPKCGFNLELCPNQIDNKSMELNVKLVLCNSIQTYSIVVTCIRTSLVNHLFIAWLISTFAAIIVVVLLGIFVYYRR